MVRKDVKSRTDKGSTDSHGVSLFRGRHVVWHVRLVGWLVVCHNKRPGWASNVGKQWLGQQRAQRPDPGVREGRHASHAR